MTPTVIAKQKIPVGISTCLLGEPVRYNGGHKKSAYCVDTLSELFEFKPFCPEMAIGLGVPRETIRVVFNRESEVTSVENQAGTHNHQPALAAFADTVATQHQELCGYVLMKDSPSCGMERVKRFNENGNLQDNRGQGAFAARLMQAKPWLPIEESGRLNDPNLRENFILRVCVLSDFMTQVEREPSAKALVAFHSRHKYLIMAHNQLAYRELGRLVAQLKAIDLTAVADLYKQRLMQALNKPAGRRGNTNALMHIQGYLKRDLDKPQKQRLTQVIAQYRQGDIPLNTPVTLLSFLLEQCPNDYVLQQSYLNPYPDHLKLRNAI